MIPSPPPSLPFLSGPPRCALAPDDRGQEGRAVEDPAPRRPRPPARRCAARLERHRPGRLRRRVFRVAPTGIALPLRLGMEPALPWPALLHAQAESVRKDPWAAGHRGECRGPPAVGAAPRAVRRRAPRLGKPDNAPGRKRPAAPTRPGFSNGHAGLGCYPRPAASTRPNSGTASSKSCTRTHSRGVCAVPTSPGPRTRQGASACNSLASVP